MYDQIGQESPAIAGEEFAAEAMAMCRMLHYLVREADVTGLEMTKRALEMAVATLECERLRRPQPH